MRIISGKARGTKLYTLDGLEVTRPTLDRVKESMFNIISDEIYGATVLDLFAGSGAIGLEFASRGASKVYMCDYSKDAIEIINKNTQKTHLEEASQIYKGDYKEVLLKLKNNKFDLIYIDPPYKTDYIKEAIERIIELDMISSKGKIIAETDEPKKIIDDINEMDKINIIDQRKYGRVSLIFLEARKSNLKSERE